MTKQRSFVMKVVALVSGGKDSCYAMWLATKEGHEVVALANLLPQKTDPDELDSYTFQTVSSSGAPSVTSCDIQSSNPYPWS